MYLKAWEAICKSLTEGGMGFQSLENFNLSMLAKMGWRLKENPDSLCVKLLKAKYYPGTDILHMKTKPKQRDSWVWKGILNGVE